MLPYIPERAPDELLYSWIARISLINQLGAPRAAISMLFGGASVTPSVDFPAGLKSLSISTSCAAGSVADMIDGGTLYPYYRPFSPRTHAQVVHTLSHGIAGGLRMSMGHTANAFGLIPELRYCPECLRLDAQKCGFSYWHRSHHLPGVRICHLHLCLLVPMHGAERRSRLELTLPPAHGRDFFGCVPPWQREFAEASAKLLHASLPPIDPTRLRRLYLVALRGRGLARSRSGVLKADCAAISDDLRDHYGDFIGFVHRTRLLRSERTPGYWIHSIFGRPTAASHPVCHLLIWLWLFGSVDGFLSAYRELSDVHGSQVSQKARKSAQESEKVHGLRERWTKMLEDERCVKAARALAASTYAALYRNDRDWLLEANKRTQPDQRRVSAIVNWPARDADLCIRATVVATEMRMLAPNQRLTISRMRRSLGEAMVTRNAPKLPLLNRLLEELAETSDAYHRRRILQALERFRASGEAVTWSGIQRAAGLRKWDSTLRGFALESLASKGIQPPLIGRALVRRQGQS